MIYFMLTGSLKRLIMLPPFPYIMAETLSIAGSGILQKYPSIESLKVVFLPQVRYDFNGNHTEIRIL